MFDIISLGELLIDFTPAGRSEQNNALYECNPGGGAANLAVAAAVAGAHAAFIGKVGDDTFGRVLRDMLQKCHVDTSGLIMTDAYPTTLAFVHLFENGDRDFTFYRQNGADAHLEISDVKFALLDQTRCLHVSSITMTRDAGMHATLKAIQYARQKGIWTTYDPNWRPRLWADAEQCRQRMQMPIEFADIIKISEEELYYITGKKDMAAAAKILLQRGPRLVMVTRGSAGSAYYCAQGGGEIRPFEVDAVDTTGTGDCFLGNAVWKMQCAGIDLDQIDTQKLEDCLLYASAAAALCATTKGAMPAMPPQERVLQFMRESS